MIDPESAARLADDFEDPQPLKGKTTMANYSKLFGSILGSVLGIGVSKGVLPAEWATPDVQAAIMVLLSAAAVYFFPANKPR